jgi:hypothetical protein
LKLSVVCRQADSVRPCEVCSEAKNGESGERKVGERSDKEAVEKVVEITGRGSVGDAVNAELEAEAVESHADEVAVSNGGESIIGGVALADEPWDQGVSLVAEKAVKLDVGERRSTSSEGGSDGDRANLRAGVGGKTGGRRETSVGQRETEADKDALVEGGSDGQRDSSRGRGGCGGAAEDRAGVAVGAGPEVTSDGLRCGGVEKESGVVLSGPRIRFSEEGVQGVGTPIQDDEGNGSKGSGGKECWCLIYAWGYAYGCLDSGYVRSDVHAEAAGVGGSSEGGMYSDVEGEIVPGLSFGCC